jgi:hypothetical protein
MLPRCTRRDERTNVSRTVARSSHAIDVVIARVEQARRADDDRAHTTYRGAG